MVKAVALSFDDVPLFVKGRKGIVFTDVYKTFINCEHKFIIMRTSPFCNLSGFSL